jgi:hypothetical protein
VSSTAPPPKKFKIRYNVLFRLPGVSDYWSAIEWNAPVSYTKSQALSALRVMRRENATLGNLDTEYRVVPLIIEDGS